MIHDLNTNPNTCLYADNPVRVTPDGKFANPRTSWAYSLRTESIIRRDGNGGAVSESSHQWVKGCAFGCGGIVVLFVLLIVGMSFSMRRAFDDAHTDRTILEEQFGDVDAFTPAVDGSVQDGRVAAFLKIRESLAEIHGEIQDVDEEMGQFDDLTADGEPELRVALPAVFRLTKSMMGLPWVFGEIESARNKSLVAAGMGIGEYTYMYVLAYHDQLVAPSDEANLFSASATNSRVRADLREMIRRQVTAAREQLPEGGDWLGVLETESALLDADSARIPWQDGLPAQIAVCFNGSRQALDATYSAAAAEFELLNSTIRGGGMSIQMD